jgi:hypothetical protein
MKKKQSIENRRGRPTKYKPEYCAALVKYFSVSKSKRVVKAFITGKNEYTKEEYESVPNELPTFAKFARKRISETSCNFNVRGWEEGPRGALLKSWLGSYANFHPDGSSGPPKKVVQYNQPALSTHHQAVETHFFREPRRFA